MKIDLNESVLRKLDAVIDYYVRGQAHQDNHWQQELIALKTQIKKSHDCCLAKKLGLLRNKSC